jgi:hypothetical protein
LFKIFYVNCKRLQEYFQLEFKANVTEELDRGNFCNYYKTVSQFYELYIVQAFQF